MKKVIGLFSTLAVLTVSANAFAAPEKFAIDTSHSKVGFAITHLAISEVEGHFGDFTGELVWDEADPAQSSINGTIKVTSINTANQKRDDHLRNADFFDVEKFPDMTFKTSKIEKKDAGYLATGTLTLKGVAKEVQIPFTTTAKVTDPWGGVRIGLKGGLSINRKDFGLTWNKALDTGGFVLGDEVKISLSAEATLAK